MVTIEELKRRKKELGYTNAEVSERSGVPLGTVQKVFSGATAHPRLDTLEALERVLKPQTSFGYRYEMDLLPNSVMETSPVYTAVSDMSDSAPGMSPARRVDNWIAGAPSERWPRQGEYTLDDYYALPDDVRVELIDGVIYDMASPSEDHQMILGDLFMQFYHCIHDHGRACEVYFAPLDVRLDGDDRTMVQPDLFVVCERDGDPPGAYIEGAPDLAVEVLSPSTRVKDCTLKLRKYMASGVREYWIVDPRSETVLVYLFDEDVLPANYSFDDTIPIGISGGECSVDFGRISARLQRGPINRPDRRK